MCRNNLFACRFGCSRGHSCMRMAVENPDKRKNNANIFSELAVHTKSKMILFTSGLLQGFTFSGKFCTQSATRRPPKLWFCLDAFALKVACD